MICLNKADTAQDERGELDESTLDEIETYRRVGYRVLLTSAQHRPGHARIETGA